MAKKIINGRMYNTETAQVLGTWSNGWNRGDFNFEEETLHKKKTGEYFIYGHGGAMSSYGESCGDGNFSGERFTPISEETAKEWAEKYLDAEEYIAIWGEPEE